MQIELGVLWAASFSLVACVQGAIDWIEFFFFFREDNFQKVLRDLHYYCWRTPRMPAWLDLSVCSCFLFIVQNVFSGRQGCGSWSGGDLNKFRYRSARIHLDDCMRHSDWLYLSLYFYFSIFYRRSSVSFASAIFNCLLCLWYSIRKLIRNTDI